MGNEHSMFQKAYSQRQAATLMQRMTDAAMN